MKHYAVTTPLLALGLALLGAGDRPKFAPKDGLELTRSYKGSLDLKSAPMRMLADGEEIPTEGGPKISLTIHDERVYEFKDQFEQVADGRAEKLLRTFETISSKGFEKVHVEGPDGKENEDETEKSRTSGLEGKQVRFTWDAEAEDYDLALVEKGDDDLLEDQDIDADYAGLLPPKDVEEGTEWKLEAKVLSRVDEPAGDLHLVVEGEDEDETSKQMNDQLDENVAGEAKAIWRGIKEEGGRKLGRIELTGDFTTKGEVEDEGRKRAMELEVEYTGEALWDMEGGHLARIELRGEVKAVFTISQTRETPSGSVVLSQVFDMQGESKHLYEITR